MCSSDLGTSAYVDAAAALGAFLTFYLTQIWEEQRTDGLLIAIGLVGGYCYAVKYTMAVMLVYAAIFVWWKGGFRAALRVSTTSAVLILPWMIKNWIYFQNPIAPFGNTIFRNPFIHPEFERYWSEYLRHYEMTNLWQLPLEVTIHGEKLGGALGPVFLAAPKIGRAHV